MVGCKWKQETTTLDADWWLTLRLTGLQLLVKSVMPSLSATDGGQPIRL